MQAAKKHKAANVLNKVSCKKHYVETAFKTLVSSAISDSIAADLAEFCGADTPANNGVTELMLAPSNKVFQSVTAHLFNVWEEIMDLTRRKLLKPNKTEFQEKAPTADELQGLCAPVQGVQQGGRCLSLLTAYQHAMEETKKSMVRMQFKFKHAEGGDEANAQVTQCLDTLTEANEKTCVHLVHF